jgi:hypothetical protein
MECYDCNVTVEPRSYPEGRCPKCDVTYILSDSEWESCDKCGDVPASGELDGMCLGCYLTDT